MIELTREQHQALAGETVPQVRDPETNETYFLVRADLYNRLCQLIDEDDARFFYHKLADIDPEDWEDISNYQRTP